MIDNMDFKINSKYIITFSVDGHQLTYTAIIIDDDGDFITFKDKFNETISYNKKNLISIREVKE